MKKLFLLAAAGAGYVLGARAGRERYEQIVRAKNRVAADPRVQQAADRAREQAPVVKDKVSSAASNAASSARDKVSGGPDPAVGDAYLNPESTHFQDDPGPKGDLP